MKINAAGIVAGCLIVGFGSFVVYSYTENQVADALTRTNLALDAQIAEQELVLVTVADLVKQSAADEITERIIVDCSGGERQRFDQLLDRLSINITRTELTELDTLFLKCGRFYADRKSVMAARLMREVSVYKSLIELREQTSEFAEVSLERVQKWQQVAEAEMVLATNFTKLVDLQGDIILTLLAGKDRNSTEIKATLEEVQNTRNNMTMQSKQVDNLRSGLQTI